MNFKEDKILLESEFVILKLQSEQTNEGWVDSVQERFYKEYINEFPKEFLTYTNELNKLDKIFDESEMVIESLIN